MLVKLVAFSHMQDQLAFADVLTAVRPHQYAIRGIFEARAQQEAETLGISVLQSQVAEAKKSVQAAELAAHQHRQVLDMARQASYSEQVIQEAAGRHSLAQGELCRQQDQQSKAMTRLNNAQKDLEAFRNRLAECLSNALFACSVD